MLYTLLVEVFAKLEAVSVVSEGYATLEILTVPSLLKLGLNLTLISTSPKNGGKLSPMGFESKEKLPISVKPI